MRYQSIITCFCILLGTGLFSVQSQVPFSEILIDETASGDNKAIADIDNDGIKDLILGGKQFSWYRMENGKYIKYTIAVPKVEFTTDMETGDFDNDGDIDLFVADGKDENNVMWYENPLPEKSPVDVKEWKKHIIGTHGDWMHNLTIGDVNLDYRLDVVSSGHGFTRLWLNKGKDGWKEVNLSEYGGGPVDAYDMDNDADLDIVTSTGWVECPQDAFTQKWIFHPITGMHGETVRAGDIDNDGIAEILVADSSHYSTRTANTEGKLHMFKRTGSLSDNTWQKSEIDPECRTHKLQVADFNRDGYADILYGLELKEIGILYQQPDGTFKKDVISHKGGHNAVAGDVDNDGDLDILSCDFLAHPPLKLFLNQSEVPKTNKRKPLSIHRWRYNRATSNHMQTFGLAFGEVTGDKRQDIISGNYIYENPGMKNNVPWKQYLISKDLHAVIAIDINGDKKDEIIAVDGNINVYWCQGEKDNWKINLLGKLPKASHAIGAQGHIKGKIIPGKIPQIIMTAGGGIYAFRVPADPSTSWPMIHISKNSSDEGIDIVDINGDGWNDLAGTNGETHEVLWYENPKSFTDNWKSHVVGTVVAGKNYLDRIAGGDLNGDKKPDIVLSEENQGGPASTIVFLQPDNPESKWIQQPLVNQSTTNSMDVADMDGDGDADIITGEHRGGKRVIVWENDGRGKFRPFLIDQGKESHDGAKITDLDGDGDLDIVSIGYDKYSVIHIWWNDAIVK